MQTNKTVYFVRHGESADNAAPVFQSPDSPLTQKGRMQAEKIATRAKHLSFDAFITSPFRRAEETAEIISKATEKTPERSALFVERTKPTSVNGKLHTDEEASEVWREWNESLYTPGMRVEDGENFDDIITRADNALAFLNVRPEKSILVVTHGYFLRTIITRVLMQELLSAEAFKKFQRMASMENTGLSALRYEGNTPEEMRWRLWIYNDHSHLG
jgi:probable phosphoglycerate mutase